MLDPNTKIRYRTNNVFGGAVYLGRRTAAHLDATRAQAEKVHGRDVTIIQGAFNTGVAASAGTHDFDRVLDVTIPGLTPSDAQRFFRANGWAAWYRYPPMFSPHIHMISLGGTGRVGIYVPGQIADYYGNRSGLAGHASDYSWHPDNIAATIFNYAGSLKEEDDVNDAEHKAVMQVPRILDLLQKALPNIAERDRADRARDHNLAAAVDRGFADLERELNDSSTEVKAKVTEARERVVTAVRNATENDNEESPK